MAINYLGVARAGGFTAYILLTLSIAVGLALTMQEQYGEHLKVENRDSSY
jgi:hypothetical protein